MIKLQDPFYSYMYKALTIFFSFSYLCEKENFGHFHEKDDNRLFTPKGDPDAGIRHQVGAQLRFRTLKHSPEQQIKNISPKK